MKFLMNLIDYIHSDETYDVRSYIMKDLAKTKNNNKGFFWEKVLEKAMSEHTKLLEHNAKYRDFADNSEAKFATFYKRKDGVYEASISGIQNKIGPLRICLCVPGIKYHKVYFLFIPYKAYQPYIKGSTALKITLNAQGKPQGKLAEKYLCSFKEVTRPYYK